MKKTIKLNNEISIDIEKLIESRMVILANSGGGKSYAVRRIAEEAVGSVQVIILDPEGEFASLREKYDFILCGKDADVPAEPRSAALLATKLLELNKSAVIDLYELHPRERQQFVKIFCESLVNCPKELYHPVIIVLDEAHEYVPEGKPCEATYAVEALASKGRKRGQCLILASQRIAKLSKDAAAECNNKLVGRASQDIDMKRAGEELGFTKDRFVELRQLKPGDFFAFGPAISDEVMKMRVGEVRTSHAKVGYKGVYKAPPPSDVILKVLGELRDLPQAAEKELRTIAEIRQELAVARRKITELEKDGSIDKVREMGIDHMKKQHAINTLFEKWKKVAEDYLSQIDHLHKTAHEVLLPDVRSLVFNPDSSIGIPVKSAFSVNIHERKDGSLESKETSIGQCAKAILSYLHINSRELRTKTQVAIATGYSRNSGGFNNSISELCSQDMIERVDSKLRTKHALYNDLLIIPIDKSLWKWVSKLPLCASKILELMLNDINGFQIGMSKDIIASETGYSVNSGGFKNSLSELSSLGLIERHRNIIRFNPEILNL